MELKERFAGWVEGFSFFLLFAAFATIQVLIGGTRMVFSMPAYALLGALGVLAIFLLRRPKPTPSQACLVSAAVFFSYILARAYFSPVPHVTRSDVYSVLGGLAVYLFVACILTRAKQRMAFVTLLLVLGVAHTIIGALQFREDTNYMPISWLQRVDYDTRASGFYICPNHLAGLLEVLGVIGLSMVCWSRWPVWSKLLIGYVVGVCYAGVAMTGSRGGYLSTATSLMVFAALSLLTLWRTSGKLFWKIGGAGAVIAVGAAALVFFSFAKSDYLTSRAQNTFETTNMRIDLWKGALEQWKLAPILGTGTGTYLYFGRLFRTPRVQHDPVYVHNDYLHLLAEYGIIGALGMAAFLFVHLWRGARSFSRLGPKRVAVSRRLLSNALALNIGAIAAVMSYVVHSGLDFNLHIPANVLLLSFVFGLLANDGVERADFSSLPAAPGAWLGRIALPAIGLLLLIQCARLFPGEYLAERSRAALRDGQPATSILFAVKGIERDPGNPELHYYLALARLEMAEQAGHPRAASSFRRAAIEALERARAMVPQEKLYALELATVLDAEGRYEEAEWAYYDARQLDPKSESLRRYYEGHLNQWRNPQPTEPAAPETEEPAPHQEEVRNSSAQNTKKRFAEQIPAV